MARGMAVIVKNSKNEKIITFIDLIPFATALMVVLRHLKYKRVKSREHKGLWP